MLAALDIGSTVDAAAAAGHQIEAGQPLGYIPDELFLLDIAKAALINQRAEQINAQIQIAFSGRASGARAARLI